MTYAAASAASMKVSSQPQRGMNTATVPTLNYHSGTTTISSITPSQHAPSAVGSVLEASDGLGGKCYIRLQNIAATST
jgi:hypothetical protein